MSAWEYCALDYNTGRLLVFTPDGASERLTGVESVSCAAADSPVQRIIAELGGDGWDMTGVGGEFHEALLFKRPVPSGVPVKSAAEHESPEAADEIEEASRESFPASDAPAWTAVVRP